MRRLVATAGKDGVLRVLDRETHGDRLPDAGDDARERGQAGDDDPIRVCPGLLGGLEWNGPAYNPGTNLLYTPAVDWCTTFVAFEDVRHIPGQAVHGRHVQHGSGRKRGRAGSPPLMRQPAR